MNGKAIAALMILASANPRAFNGLLPKQRAAKTQNPEIEAKAAAKRLRKLRRDMKLGVRG